MPDLAMRVETQGGTYTNYPGETTAVFDVTVASVIYDEQEAFGLSDDGRPTIASSQGAIVVNKEYACNIHQAPNGYSVGVIDKGIYADNPATEDNIATEVAELLGAGRERHVTTFIGKEAVSAALGQLMSFDSCRAAYVADMVAISVNHAQRKVQG